MARAKQTDRSEARRKYRQAQAESMADEPEELDEEPEAARSGDRAKAASARGQQPARDARPGPARPGFTSAFRAAYHPAHVREDLAALPMLLRSRAFLGGLATLLVGVAIAVYFRDYTGGLFALQLIVAPGSALLPQLVTGFFARRASYVLGFLIGLIQGLVFLVLINLAMSNGGDGPIRLGEAFTQDVYNQAIRTSFIEGPVISMLFASGAAWYRRFLALSSPRGGARSGTSRAAARGSKPTPSKRSTR